MTDVIVVAYNHAAFLLQCLDSFRNQTNQEFRLWIIDDHSPDHSAEVIKSWCKENPQIEARLFLNSINRGLLKNLNAVIPQTSGAFLKIIAADDFLSPDYLQKNIEAAQQTSDGVGVFFSKAAYVDEEGRILPDKDYYQQDYSQIQDFQPLLFQKNIIAAPSLFFRRTIFEKIGLYDESVLLEDYDLLLKALSHNMGFKFINETLTFYRTHPENTTKIRRQRIHEETALLKMRYDTQGAFSKEVHRTFLYVYQKYGLSPALLEAYKNYTGYRPLFLSSLEKKLPYLWLKILQKLV